MTAKERLAQIKIDITALREEAKVKAQAVFHEESKRLFEEFPALRAFRWDQYTPYFNDGDACVFGVNDYLCYIFEEDGYNLSDKEWYCDINWDNDIKYCEICVNRDYDIKKLEEKSDPNLAAIKAVSEFFKTFDGEDFEHMFGDHVEVIVTEGDTIVNEYEHD